MERKGELQNSKSRKSGIKCDYSSSILITVKWLRPRMWILSIKSVEIITCVGVGVTKKHNEFEQ